MQGFSKDITISTIGDDITINELTTEFVEFYNIDEHTHEFSSILDKDIVNTDQLITFLTDLGNEIVSGPDSLIYVKNKSKFVKANQIEVGDKLVCPTGDSIQYVTHLTTSMLTEEDNYDLYTINHLLDESFGYFVDGILVKTTRGII